MTPPVPVPTGVIDILINAAVQFDLIPPTGEVMAGLGIALAELNGAHVPPLYPPPGHELDMASGAFRPGAVLAVLDSFEEASAAPDHADGAGQVLAQLREQALMRMPQDARARRAARGWPDGRPVYLNHPDYLAAMRVPPRSVTDMPTTED